ncbi:hypothetical protein VNO77_37429 [Canavalia gladiata]|uniref:Uncharacterized protein n=1 Tax=Canavalia gladiata TaxID=3824 RepID=A0AAN9K8X4_CANGL
MGGFLPIPSFYGDPLSQAWNRTPVTRKMCHVLGTSIVGSRDTSHVMTPLGLLEVSSKAALRSCTNLNKALPLGPKRICQAALWSITFGLGPMAIATVVRDPDSSPTDPRLSSCCQDLLYGLTATVNLIVVTIVQTKCEPMALFAAMRPGDAIIGLLPNMVWYSLGIVSILGDMAVQGIFKGLLHQLLLRMRKIRKRKAHMLKARSYYGKPSFVELYKSRWTSRSRQCIHLTFKDHRTEQYLCNKKRKIYEESNLCEAKLRGVQERLLRRSEAETGLECRSSKSQMLFLLQGKLEPVLKMLETSRFFALTQTRLECKRRNKNRKPKKNLWREF